MTDLRQHFFSDRIVNKCNTLSKDIVSASSLNNYKGKLGKSTQFVWPGKFMKVSYNDSLSDKSM